MAVLAPEPLTGQQRHFEPDDLLQIPAAFHSLPNTYHGNGSANGTWVLVPNSAAVADLANLSALAVRPFDPARYARGDGILQCRLVCDYFVNNVAPGIGRTFQLGLYPVTNPNNALVAADLGSPVAGSTPSLISAPAAGASDKVESGWFTAPAVRGLYAVGFVQAGGNVAAGSFITFIAPDLQVRRVVNP